MHGRLAVSDSLQGLLAILMLPDLEVGSRIRMPFSPGRLLMGSSLYCADASDPLVHVLNRTTFALEKTFSTAPEIEALSLSHNGMYLYVLAGGADSVQMLDAGQGRLLNIVHTGMHPRGLAQDDGGRSLAVACGGTCEVALLDAATLRVRATFQIGGVVCDVCFFAGKLMALCAAGEYDLGTIVGAIDVDGKWKPWTALPGIPGAMAPCGGGLLVGHLQCLTMLEPPNGRIRWQTKIAGLPTEIVPLGRAACITDELDGLVSLIDLRRGTIMRRLRVGEPKGLAVLDLTP